MDTEHWVRHTHELFLSEPFDEVKIRRPSSLALFGADPDEHKRNDFARQIVAWLWTTRFEKKKGLRTKLWPEHKDDHYLDTTYGALVACEMAIQQRRRKAARSTVTTAAEWFGEA
jgi:hypothetical protein